MNAVLAELSFRGFGNTKEDKSVTDETKARLGLTNKKAGKWQKFLLPPAALKRITEMQGAARREHDLLTLKWSKGMGMLAISGREAYETRMERCRGRWREAVDDFCATYWSVHIPAAREMLGSTFNSADYPPADRIRSYFSFTYTIFPVPDASHFDARLQEIYSGQLTTEVNRRVGEAVAELWTRLLEPVQKMAERLNNPEAVFRDSLVGNIQQIVEIMPALNLTGDSRIAQATAQIQAELANLDPEKLRKDGAVRARAAVSANNIIASFGAMGMRSVLLEPTQHDADEPPSAPPPDDDPANTEPAAAPAAGEEEPA